VLPSYFDIKINNILENNSIDDNVYNGKKLVTLTERICMDSCAISECIFLRVISYQVRLDVLSLICLRFTNFNRSAKKESGHILNCVVTGANGKVNLKALTFI
jgi:hypothetical protein